MENRKPDITEWTKKSAEAGLVNKDELERVLINAGTKKSRLENSGLPIGVSYGPFDSWSDIEQAVPNNKRDNIQYFIRCVPKDYETRSKLTISRLPNASWLEVKEYYDRLSGGSDKYTIQLFETWQPDYSGGLVINNGRVMVDLEQGDKFFYKKEDDKSQPVGATMDVSGQESGKFDLHFNYANNPTDEEKQIMLQTVKYLNPQLDRELFEKLQVYADYFYSREHGFKFVEYWEGEEAKKYIGFNRPI